MNFDQLVRNRFSSPLIIAAVALLPACGSVPGKASPDDPAGNFSQVSPALYRGGRPDAPGIQSLVRLKVKTIVDLEDDDEAIASEKTWAAAAGIKFVSKPMNGLERPSDGEVNDILANINDAANQPVFVHCMQGRDRTGLIVALYRVFSENWTPKEAHDEMMALGFNSILLAMNHYFEDKTHWDD
jgi:tyrosine-protein phosphatase SIW14